MINHDKSARLLGHEGDLHGGAAEVQRAQRRLRVRADLRLRRLTGQDLDIV